MQLTRRHLDIILYNTYADLKSESSRTYAGFAWWIIDPVANMLVFYVVFSYILDRGTQDYTAFLLTGMVVWRWFSATLSQGGVSINTNSGIAQQVYVPKVLFPLVVALTNTVKFSVAFAALLAFLWLYGFSPTIHYGALPVILAIQFVLNLGVTLVICGLTPFMPDLNLVMEHFILRLAFFLSGIFFPASDVPEFLRGWFYANPMLVLIESYRDVLMYARWPDFTLLGGAAIGGGLALALGWVIIDRNDLVYAKNLA
jgi:lipopolysaccharide transport system permease protein